MRDFFLIKIHGSDLRAEKREQQERPLFKDTFDSEGKRD